MRKIVPKTSKPMTDSPRAESPKPIYPIFRIDLEHLPEAKKWDLQKDYIVSLNLKMVGISMSRFQNDAEFEVRGIEVESPKEEKSSSEEKEYTKT